MKQEGGADRVGNSPISAYNRKFTQPAPCEDLRWVIDSLVEATGEVADEQCFLLQISIVYPQSLLAHHWKSEVMSFHILYQSVGFRLAQLEMGHKVAKEAAGHKSSCVSVSMVTPLGWDVCTWMKSLGTRGP